MINHLKGRVFERGKDHLVLECHGIGFRVAVTAATLGRIPEAASAETTLLTHLHFRDGGADFFGFSSIEEREIFHSLTSVSGVGPKSAMSVLSVLGAEGVISGVLRGDAKAFSAVPGIGKKLAQRMVSELPDRIQKISAGHPDLGVGTRTGDSGNEAEAIEALVSLGYPRADVLGALSRTRESSGENSDTEAMIRAGLSWLSGSRR